MNVGFNMMPVLSRDKAEIVQFVAANRSKSSVFHKMYLTQVFGYQGILILKKMDGNILFQGWDRNIISGQSCISMYSNQVQSS